MHVAADMLPPLTNPWRASARHRPTHVGAGKLAQILEALARHAALNRHIGPVLRVPCIRRLGQHPDITAVLKLVNEQRISTFGGT